MKKEAKINYSSKFDLTNKTALITGGSGILGRHFCRGLADSGANIIVADIDESGAKEVAEELKTEYQIKAIGVGCDVSSPNSVNNLISEGINEFGTIEILHNNAASKSSDLDAFFAPFEEYSLEEWRKIMSVNIDGMFLVAQAVGKQMLKQKKGGSIIQMASIYGAMAPDHRIYEGSFYMNRQIGTPAVYVASKAAVIGLTKYLATYWADKNIRVNTLTPGGVESGQNDEFKNRYSQRIPMGRMAQADEMVGTLVFLASDAASYITGQNFLIDGGLSAW
jgi:NAD(P)-dependent dehydrogenase (short-subunit alcohol dehydrogenase family)